MNNANEKRHGKAKRKKKGSERDMTRSKTGNWKERKKQMNGAEKNKGRKGHGKGKERKRTGN